MSWLDALPKVLFVVPLESWHGEALEVLFVVLLDSVHVSILDSVLVSILDSVATLEGLDAHLACLGWLDCCTCQEEMPPGWSSRKVEEAECSLPTFAICSFWTLASDFAQSR